MVNLYTYRNGHKLDMVDWLLDRGYKDRWNVELASLTDLVHSAFRNRLVHKWTFEDENLALQFKLVWGSEVYVCPQELADKMKADLLKILI
jgi:hypothetical protein